MNRAKFTQEGNGTTRHIRNPYKHELTDPPIYLFYTA